MGMGRKLRFEITEWGVLAMVIVVVSVVLLQFKDITGVTASLNTTIDLFLEGLSEPANWVAIVIISLIGFGLIALFTKDR